VLRDLKGCRVIAVRRGSDIVATVTLATKKPWAIDPSYFTPVPKAVYVLSMAVAPAAQRQGIGRRLIEEAKTIARAWPADAIRLDAHDAEAGAAPFYAKCGFRQVGRVVYRKTPLVYFETLF
jgi:GNAT superfamily N-acetyltransferase